MQATERRWHEEASRASSPLRYSTAVKLAKPHTADITNSTHATQRMRHHAQTLGPHSHHLSFSRQTTTVGHTTSSCSCCLSAPAADLLQIINPDSATFQVEPSSHDDMHSHSRTSVPLKPAGVSMAMQETQQHPPTLRIRQQWHDQHAHLMACIQKFDQCQTRPTAGAALACTALGLCPLCLNLTTDSPSHFDRQGIHHKPGMVQPAGATTHRSFNK